MKRTLILEIICFFFIVLFVYAAVTKLLDYEKFTVQIGQSPLLTDIAGFVGWFIPAIEIVIAAMLVFSKTRLLGLYGALMLMVSFTLYILAILNFAETIPCSCGGALASLNWWQHLVFNIAFVLLAGAGIVLLSKKREDTGTVALQH